MARRRFLFNGDVTSNITHWQFKIWDDGEMLGEKIVNNNGESVVISLKSKNQNLIELLFNETSNYQYSKIEIDPSHIDLLIEDDALGYCIIPMFWQNSNFKNLQNIILQLIEGIGTDA